MYVSLLLLGHIYANRILFEEWFLSSTINAKLLSSGMGLIFQQKVMWNILIRRWRKFKRPMKRLGPPILEHSHVSNSVARFVYLLFTICFKLIFCERFFNFSNYCGIWFVAMLRGILDEDSLKLYTLIWCRTVACQMKPEISKQVGSLTYCS